MDLPRLGETQLSGEVGPPGVQENTGPDYLSSMLPAGPLPAWFRVDPAEDFNDHFQDEAHLHDLHADRATRPIALRSLQWIKKHLGSLKVTVSLQR